MIIKDFDLNDVFLFSEIIDKMGLEADVSKIQRKITVSKLENKEDATALGKDVAISIGADLIMKIIRNLYKAKNEVMQFITNMTGLNKEAVSKMNLKKIKKFFIELTKHEGFTDFLFQQEGQQE